MRRAPPLANADFDVMNPAAPIVRVASCTQSPAARDRRQRALIIFLTLNAFSADLPTSIHSLPPNSPNASTMHHARFSASGSTVDNGGGKSWETACGKSAVSSPSLRHPACPAAASLVSAEYRGASAFHCTRERDQYTQPTMKSWCSITPLDAVNDMRSPPGWMDARISHDMSHETFALLLCLHPSTPVL